MFSQRFYHATWLLLGLLTVFCNAVETVEEAARLARDLVDIDSSATLATVYPSDHPTMASQPFALMEYYASCHSNGSLSFIFMPISQNNRNILHSPGQSATFTVASRPPQANTARVALMGNVTIHYPGHDDEEGVDAIERCFLERHPDAKWWIPGRKPAHTAFWARFDPHTIYYVGGFGNEHFIGFIPLSLYQGARSEQLPGRPRPEGGLQFQH